MRSGVAGDAVALSLLMMLLSGGDDFVAGGAC